MRRFIDLRISGLGINIQEISERLSMTPDNAYKKGDIHIDNKYGGEKIVYEEDCWISEYKANEHMRVDEQLENFLAELKSSSAYLKGLADKHKVTIWVSLFPDIEQANLHISLSTINALSDMGATLDCSMAFLGDFYSGNY